MVNRFIRKPMQRPDSKTITIIVFSVLLIIAAVSIIHLSIVISDLTAKRDSLNKELEETRPYIQLSNDQALYIEELEGKVDVLTDSATTLEKTLGSLESEISKLEKNLNVLGDIKDKTNE